jgi:outer membrane protein assembly factor BamB
MSEIKSLAALLVLSLGMFVLPLSAADDTSEWPCWQGPKRDGKSPDTGLLKEWPAGGPELLWQVNGLGGGYSTVAVSDGMVYTTGDVDDKLVLFAFDMNGKPKWKIPVEKAYTRSHPGSRSTPTIDNGKLYLLSGNGIFTCFNSKTGKQYWSKDLRSFDGRPSEWGYAESVLIYEDLAIVKPGGDNCIIAFNKTTGETVWQSKGFRAEPEYSSCVAFTHDQVPMIATGTRAGVVGVSAKTGDLLWNNSWCTNNTANCPDPVYTDGFVFWANGYGKGGICLKLSTSNGKVSAREVWTTRDMDCHHGGYIVHEGHIYGNHNGGWSCLELKTGQQKWYEKAVGKGSLCFADGMLYLFGERGGRAALATCSPDSMEIKGTMSVQGTGTSWAHPVVIGGRLYLRYADNLYCFDVKARK